MEAWALKAVIASEIYWFYYDRSDSIVNAADELSRRLARIFLKDADGKRPVFEHHPLLQSDPHFRDYVLFYEYFHGDTGAGLGASHQTGWTGIVAKLIHQYAEYAMQGKSPNVITGDSLDVR